MAKVDVMTETIIDCPVTTVASYAADPDDVPKWCVNSAVRRQMGPQPPHSDTRS